MPTIMAMMGNGNVDYKQENQISNILRYTFLAEANQTSPNDRVAHKG